MPSRRTGTTASPRSARRSIREASEKSTTASVASASAWTWSPSGLRSTRPSTSVPSSSPNPVKTIGAVTDVPESRPDAAAYASSATATLARAHSTARAYVTL